MEGFKVDEKNLVVDPGAKRQPVEFMENWRNVVTVFYFGYDPCRMKITCSVV